jgi:hypothetical protein
LYLGLDKSYNGTICSSYIIDLVTNIQVPFLFGVTAIEKIACCVIHFIFRRTGKHLFLTDNDDGKPPLLQRMVDDCGDLQFMYACLCQLPLYAWIVNIPVLFMLAHFLL